MLMVAAIPQNFTEDISEDYPNKCESNVGKT